jgi:hypothetical protein
MCRKSHVRITQLICTYLRGLYLVQPSSLSFLFTPSHRQMRPRTSRLRVIGGVSGHMLSAWSTVKSVTASKSLDVAPRPRYRPLASCRRVAPTSCRGGHGGILAANGIPPETAECTSPRQRGHWIRAIGACARPTSQRASSCQAGRCIQAIGCRAMGPRRPLAPARGWPRSGNERGRVFCTRVNCAGRANHGTPAQGSPEAQARVPLVGGAAGSEQSERVLVRHARGRLRPPKPLGVAQGNQAGAWLEPEAWVPLSQWVEWIFFALMLEWPTAACRRMSPQRYGAPNVTIMSAKLTTALPTLPCHACRPHLITRRHRLQANSAAPRYSPTAVHCRRNSAHCQGRLSTAS